MSILSKIPNVSLVVNPNRLETPVETNGGKVVQFLTHPSTMVKLVVSAISLKSEAMPILVNFLGLVSWWSDPIKTKNLSDLASLCPIKMIMTSAREPTQSSVLPIGLTNFKKLSKLSFFTRFLVVICEKLKLFSANIGV